MTIMVKKVESGPGIQYCGTASRSSVVQQDRVGRYQLQIVLDRGGHQNAIGGIAAGKLEPGAVEQCFPIELYDADARRALCAFEPGVSVWCQLKATFRGHGRDFPE